MALRNSRVFPAQQNIKTACMKADLPWEKMPTTRNRPRISRPAHLMALLVRIRHRARGIPADNPGEPRITSLELPLDGRRLGLDLGRLTQPHGTERLELDRNDREFGLGNLAKTLRRNHTVPTGSRLGRHCRRLS